MNHPRHSLLTLLMVLLIAAAPMQGVFAAIAAANAGDLAQQAGMEMQHAHHQLGMNDSAAVAAAGNADENGMTGICDCCPDGVPGGCGNCEFSHCTSHHCSSTAMLSLAGNAVFADDGAAWVLPQSAQLPPSNLGTPFRPPRA